jgi:hypothetical protein
MKDLWFGLVLIVLGAVLFIWTHRDFSGLVQWTGRLSMWGGLLPATRTGLTAVSLFSLIAGLQVMTFDGHRTEADDVVATALVVLLFGGLVHDLVHWLRHGNKDRGGEP